MSMLGFSKTTSQVMERLKEMGRRSFASYMKRMESQEALVRSGNILPKVDLEHCVLEYGELAEICRKKKGYGTWYQDLYGKIESDVRTGWGRQIGRDGLEVYRQEVYRQERVPVSITCCKRRRRTPAVSVLESAITAAGYRI